LRGSSLGGAFGFAAGMIGVAVDQVCLDILRCHFGLHSSLRNQVDAGENQENAHNKESNLVEKGHKSLRCAKKRKEAQ